jgi:hypothetical protein
MERKNREKPRNLVRGCQRKSSRKLSIRQLRLLEGLTAGKSTRRAALDAGYSNHSAGHPAELLDRPALRDALCQMIAPIEMIAERINQGLDATEVRTRCPGSRACCFSVCAGSQTTQDRNNHSRFSMVAVLPSSTRTESASCSFGFSKLDSPAHRYPCLRFKRDLAIPPARLEARMDSLFPFL